jgi:hypothetical protein
MHITPWMVWIAKIILGEPIFSVVNGDHHVAFRTAPLTPLVEFNSAVAFWADGSITLHLLKDGYVNFMEVKNNLIGIIKLIAYRMR